MIVEVVDGGLLLRKPRARYAVKKALSEGRLKKPLDCQICFNQHNISGNLYAHHHWGYEKENELRVVWLCTSCHILCHKQNHGTKYR